MKVSVLSPEERLYLLSLAQRTIDRALLNQPRIDLTAEDLTPKLQEDGASFVTLRKQNGALRGCIGSLAARRPLAEDVRENALSAAFGDPRFPPLTSAEFSHVGVEVSVLTAPAPLNFDDADDLLRKLRPNVDGVILEHGRRRATFLPQVWEQLPDPEGFLGHLCYKAGLPLNAWRWPDLKIFIYQVEKFEEEDAA